jgi:hypothetical protein
MYVALWFALWIVLGILGLLALWIGLAWSGVFKPRYAEGTHYFKGSSLWSAPIALQSPISEAEAQEMEREGRAYYIGRFGASGKPLSVEKRYQRKIFFKVNYVYENGRLVRQEAVDEDGPLKRWQALRALKDGLDF